MLEKYILNEKGRPVIETDLHKWARWFSENTKEREVAKDEVKGRTITTTFLGISHRFNSSNKPLLYETMVFGEELEFVQRYSTKKEALIGHKNIYKDLTN